jgi:dihydrofolate synthase/folylpolyglutamate synthase
MRYKKTIEYLYGLQKYGMKFGLDNIRKLMSALGNPHESFHSVHVAGTNGKGSTAAMIESILRTCCRTTGLFTSPHLVSFTERVKINGSEISESDVIELAEDVRAAAENFEDFSPTFFEVVTAMTFLHFHRMKVDWAVIEVGMGGRLDATNVINPEVSVLTTISPDHQNFLGRTLKEIALEKAGIIKKNVPVIMAKQNPDVREVIKSMAIRNNSALFQYKIDFISDMVSEDHNHICLDYFGNSKFRGIKLPLLGEHQVINASLAAKATEIISEKFPEISCDVKRGLESVRWPGRLEMIKNDPPILIDGAHNSLASSSLAKFLLQKLNRQFRRIILVIGIMSDKNIEGILQPLLPVAAETIFVSPAYERAAGLDILAACARKLGYSSKKALSVPDGLNIAEGIYLPGDLIVVTGSFYTIGEAKEALVHKGIFSRLRE